MIESGADLKNPQGIALQGILCVDVLFCWHWEST
jgi:hypothetical protein